MNYRKVICFLVILFFLLENVNTIASNRLITCVKRGNQYFVCVGDAVEIVKNHLDKTIRIVGYGERTDDEGQRLANECKSWLIDELKKKGVSFNVNQFVPVAGAPNPDVRVEFYAD